MRNAVIIVVVIASAVAAFFVYRRWTGAEARRDSFLEAAVNEPAVIDSVAVWVGRRGDLEIVVSPFYSDPVRNEFNDKTWNRQLGLSEKPLTFCAVWFIHHGDRAAALPVDGVASFHSAAISNWQGWEPIELCNAAESDVTAHVRNHLKSLSLKDRRRIDKHEFLATCVAVPREPALRDLPDLTVTGWPEFWMKPGRVLRRDLLAYESKPRGDFASHVIFERDEISEVNLDAKDR